ncbi:MAG: DUF4869 domain-containing protein [Lachnospiraceae bacterium]|nr:DUF4869 domain-containing protein [Lachnospiraceae bacterium]
MLRVYFGDKENAIYNTSVYFKHSYEDKWITDDFTKEIVKDIDKSEVISAGNISSPVLGNISPLSLSGGVKALILMKNKPGKIFNASNCGDNCAKWILKMAEKKDFTINLHHIMDFGPGEFEIRILNHRKLIVHNMKEFLDAGVKYL